MPRRKHTLATLFLAYRQAKVAYAAEQDAVGLPRYAEYERNLASNLHALKKRIARGAWFDNVDVGDVEVCPKSLSVPASVDNEPHQTVVIGDVNQSMAHLRVRLRLMPSPDFATTEILYLWEFGAVLEGLLSPECLGYRLNRVESDGEMDPMARQVYTWWPTAFSRYRDDPIRAAARLLRRDRDVTIISTDVASFFDSIDPSFLTSSKFMRRLSRQAARLQGSFQESRFRRATLSLLRQYAKYRERCADLVGVTLDPRRGIPIGSLVSRVFANVALSGLDQDVQEKRRVALYRRYVDDIVVVCRGRWATGTSPVAKVFPDFSTDDKGPSFLERTTQQRFHLNNEKTRVHVLHGRAGLEFLQSIQSSFSAVASERRALWGDVDRLTSAFEGLDLFEDGHEDRTRMPRLRDADRYTLRRYIARAVAQGLLRSAILLDRRAAAEQLAKHVPRLLAIVNSGRHVEDFDLVRSLYQVALICKAKEERRELWAWLVSYRSSLSDLIDSVRWQGHDLVRKKALRAVSSYLRKRISEARAAAGSLTTGAASAEASTLAAADLRLLNAWCSRASRMPGEGPIVITPCGGLGAGKT